MSQAKKIKKAITLFESLKGFMRQLQDSDWFEGAMQYEAEIDETLAILRPLAEEPEAGEFTKEARRFLGNHYDLLCDNEIPKNKAFQTLEHKLKEACGIIDRQASEYQKLEIEKLEAVAARVQAENDMCVLRGELEKLKEATDGKNKD